MKMTIRQLDINQAACIHAVTASGELGRRIRDMGLVPGTRVMVIGRAPLTETVTFIDG